MNYIILVSLSLFLSLTSGSFELARHDQMIQFAGAAYCINPRSPSWACPHCDPQFDSQQIIYDAITNTFGFAGVDKNNHQIVVSFRGTVEQSLANWITDLNVATLTPYPKFQNASVHAGFWIAFQSVGFQTESAVRTLLKQYPDYKVVVTGHSLGAALAVLASLEIKFTFNVTAEVYTYGGPRVGDAKFASDYKNTIPNTFRVVYAADIVPHLPPMVLSFSHMPQEVWFHNETYKVCSNKTGEDPTCSDSLPAALSVYDHIHYMGITLGSEGCQCQADNFGYLCSTFCNSQSTCSGHGSCSSVGKCECNNGYSGEQCSDSHLTTGAWIGVGFGIGGFILIVAASAVIVRYRRKGYTSIQS